MPRARSTRPAKWPERETRERAGSCGDGDGGRPAPAPLLRLQGALLARAGFATGVPVKVQGIPGRLVIEVAGAERGSRAEALTMMASRVADDGLTEWHFYRLARLLKRHRSG